MEPAALTLHHWRSGRPGRARRLDRQRTADRPGHSPSVTTSVSNVVPSGRPVTPRSSPQPSYLPTYVQLQLTALLLDGISPYFMCSFLSVLSCAAIHFFFFFHVLQLDLWGSPFPAKFLCMWLLGPTIRVVTFRLHGWCMLGVLLLLAFTHLGHECQGLLSLCDGMHVYTD